MRRGPFLHGEMWMECKTGKAWCWDAFKNEWVPVPTPQFAPSRCPCGLPWDDCPRRDWIRGASDDAELVRNCDVAGTPCGTIP